MPSVGKVGDSQLLRSLWSLERDEFIDFILGTPWRRKDEAGQSGLDADWTIQILQIKQYSVVTMSNYVQSKSNIGPIPEALRLHHNS